MWKVESVGQDVAVLQMAEMQHENLGAGAALEKFGPEQGEVAVAVKGGVFVPCSVEPILSWHLEDFLLPFQRKP